MALLVKLPPHVSSMVGQPTLKPEEDTIGDVEIKTSCGDEAAAMSARNQVPCRLASFATGRYGSLLGLH